MDYDFPSKCPKCGADERYVQAGRYKCLSWFHDAIFMSGIKRTFNQSPKCAEDEKKGKDS